MWEEPPWLDRDEFDVTECDGELLLLGLASSVPTAPPPPFTPPSGDDRDSAPEQVWSLTQLSSAFSFSFDGVFELDVGRVHEGFVYE